MARPAVAMRVQCSVTPDPARPRWGAVRVRSSVCGPVHPVHHRTCVGPDVLVLARDTAGLAGGDRCCTRIQVDDGASLVVSDAGPTGLFPSRDGRAGNQTVDLAVGPGAQAVFLPHATVPFAGSRTETTTRIEVVPSAVAVVGGVLAPGRAANGERWQPDVYHQVVELRRGDELLLCDALRAGPRSATGLLSSHRAEPAVGHLVSLLAYSAGAAGSLEAVRDAAGDGPGVSAVTDDLLVVRAIVDSSAAGYRLLRGIVSAFLPDLAAWEWSRIGYAGGSVGVG